jgi:hypothetical protein
LIYQRSSREEANCRLIGEMLNVLKKVTVGGLFCDLEKAVVLIAVFYCLN